MTPFSKRQRLREGAYRENEALQAHVRPERRRWPAQLKSPTALKKTMALTILFEGNAEERLNWLEEKKTVKAASLAMDHKALPDADAYVVESPETAPPGKKKVSGEYFSITAVLT